MASEAHLRAQYEVRGRSQGPAAPADSTTDRVSVLAAPQSLLKENKQLRGSVEKLERENRDLKRSVYELSLKSARASTARTRSCSWS